MFKPEKILYQSSTEHGSYQVVEMTYNGRPARVLFSGDRDAAFSGIALDGKPELLFDYIQRMYEIIEFMRPRTVLIIGGGTYTLPTALIHAMPDISVDAVEIDPVMDDIAKKFFNYRQNDRLQIIHMDGKQYLNKCKKQYDIILVDAFNNLEVPDSLSDQAAAGHIYDLLTPSGLAVMNLLSSYYGQSSDNVRSHLAQYRHKFEHTNIYQADPGYSLWQSQNLLLIAQKGPPQQLYGIRSAPIDESGGAI